MYRYWQSSDMSEWRIASDATPMHPWRLAVELNAARVTILALSGDPDVLDSGDISYQGGLYFDIDNLDIERALISTRELVDKLKQLDVADGDIEIHLSGSKGCHVFVDPTVFSSGRPLKNLPKIYERVAMDLYVPGIDLVIYSFGKGRMFRPPNALRPDKAYKVRVSVEELLSLTPDKYKDMVSRPRDTVWGNPPKIKATGLSVLFDMYRSAKAIEPYKGEALTDEMFAKLKGSLPPCMDDLASGKERDNTSFNRAALNVGCFTVRSGYEPGRLESLQARIADNTTSKKYHTASERKRHLQGMHSYVRKYASKYGFSCAGMLSVVSTHPCANCPVKAEVADGSVSTGNLDTLFVYRHMGQYYSDPDFEKAITSFVMSREAAVINEDSGRVEASVVKIMSPQKGVTYTIPSFSENAWVSKQEFKKEIIGLDGVALFGNDNDVARLRLTLARDTLTGVSEVRKVAKCSKVGIHYRRKSGSPDVRDETHKGIFFYIEPDFSISSLGQLDTHLLEASVSAAPSLRYGKTEFGDPITDEANEAFSLLMRVNSEKVISQVLGWYLAAHLKTHTGLLYGMHPLLCISGIAGSGKNKGIALFQRLSGLTGNEALMTLEAPTSTNLPFQLSLTNSATVPRVINELNPKSLNKAQYAYLTELLKAGFDSQIIPKGRLGGGNRNGANVSVVEWKITAPIVTLSEEPISTPALLQRAVLVTFEPSGHNYGSHAFYKLSPRADDLTGIAKALVYEAMHTPMREVDAMLSGISLPDNVEMSSLPERLKFGYKVILMGYDWALKRLPARGLLEDNIEDLKMCRKNFLQYLETNVGVIVKDSSVNEVDKVLKDIALLAYCSNDTNTTHKIEPGRHYMVQGDRLFLDILVIYPILQRFKNGSGDPLGLKTSDAFIKSAKGLRYFVSEDTIPPHMPTNGRGVLELDMVAMSAVNIPIQMFT